MATYHLDDGRPHAVWDNAIQPRLAIRPGDTVVFETLEASARQVTPCSNHPAVASLDFILVHPLTGPVHVADAEPGNGLEVEVVRLMHKAGAGTRSSRVTVVPPIASTALPTAHP